MFFFHFLFPGNLRLKIFRFMLSLIVIGAMFLIEPLCVQRRKIIGRVPDVIQMAKSEGVALGKMQKWSNMPELMLA